VGARPRAFICPATETLGTCRIPESIFKRGLRGEGFPIPESRFKKGRKRRAIPDARGQIQDAR